MSPDYQTLRGVYAVSVWMLELTGYPSLELNLRGDERRAVVPMGEVRHSDYPPVYHPDDRIQIVDRASRTMLLDLPMDTFYEIRIFHHIRQENGIMVRALWTGKGYARQ